MKKGVILSFLVFSLLTISFTSFVSAINLQINSTPINDQLVSEINLPAIFNFTIKNAALSDNFQIYTLVPGIEISPRGTFSIPGMATSVVEVTVYADDNVRENTGFLSFPYRIKGESSGIQEGTLTINVVKLKDTLSISTSNIRPNDSEATIYVQNMLNVEWPSIKASFDSSFFTTDQTFNLFPGEKRAIKVSIDKTKSKVLLAGDYTLTARVDINGVKQNFKGTIKFLEESGLSINEKSSGIIFRHRTIEKTNEGNTPVVATVEMSKDIISRLLTSFNVEPTKVDRGFFTVHYTWTKELKPSESLLVTANTNYTLPLIFLIVVIIGAWLIWLYLSSNLKLVKKVSYVRTKGGEFALRVNLTVSSRKAVSRISILDRVPGVVKIYDKFPGIAPDKVDHKSGRIEWRINDLQPGEERVFSYYIFSKLNLVGRFELPPAVARYEKEGKSYESRSNMAFFANEQFKRD